MMDEQGALETMQAAAEAQKRTEEILSCALDIGEHMLNSKHICCIFIPSHDQL